MDFPGRLIACIVALILIFIYPLQYIAGLNSDTIDTLVDDRTHKFTDTIREKGYLDKHTYEEYIGYLDTTGEMYELELQDIHPVTGDEISGVGDSLMNVSSKVVSYASFLNTGTNLVNAPLMHSQEVELGSLNLLSHNEITSFSAHIHSDACYNGTKHVHTGNTTSGGGCHGKRVAGHSHVTNCYDVYYSSNCTECSYAYGHNPSCSIPGTRYQMRHESLDCDLSTDPTYEINCGKTAGGYYDSNGNILVSACNIVVTSITATNPTQTVNKGNPIITTATATYLDGHTGIVNCTSNFNTNIIGNQTVTLTYTGLVGNTKTNGTRTCTVDVTVKPSRSLTSITATPSTQTIQKYTYPILTVKAYYSDNTNATLNSAQYKMTGFNAAKIGLQNVTISYTEDSITKSAVIKVTVKVLDKECPRCHQIYELNPDDSDPGCPNCKQLITGIEVTPNNVEVTQGDSLPITVRALYNDGSKEEVSRWFSNYNAQMLGIQLVTVEYGGYAADIIVWVNEGLITCPVCNNEYPSSEIECPTCANQIISITASPKEITVMQYQLINLTVTAYFANGSSSVVNDWSIDKTTLTPGTYTATVSYKEASDTITLTVLSVNNVVCPICGTNYDSSKNLLGCPICSEEIVEIEAYLTNGNNHIQLGTTPAITVILIFRDEHREFAKDSYTLEDFNPLELGIQTIRVNYKSFYDTIIIEVVNILDTLTCTNSHIYYKDKDGSDPGCPFCHLDEDASKILYFDITYTSEILDKVYTTGIFHFSQGNYISVIVTKKDKSLMYRLQNTFFSTSMLERKRRYIYGGEVY